MSIISRVYEFCVKHAALAKTEVFNVRHLPKDIKNAAIEGYYRAKESNKSIFCQVTSASTSVVKSGVKPHLPGVFAGVGFFSPIPLGSVFGFRFGKVLQRLI